MHKTPRLCNSFAMALKALFGGSAEKSRLLGLVIARFLCGTATGHWWPEPQCAVLHEKQVDRLIWEWWPRSRVRRRCNAYQAAPTAATLGAGDAQGGSGVWRPESGDSFPKRHSVRECQNRPAALDGDLA